MARLCSAQRRRESVLGFDTETRPTFRKGARPNPTCLVQLATKTRAYLFRLERGKPLPSPLRTLLEDASVQKVGIDASQALS